MKKIILMVISFVSLSSVTSCSKNDEAPSLLGKWEYSKTGTASNNQEVLTDYVTAVGCSKNYSVFTATTIVDHQFSGSVCTETISTLPYTKNGNTLIVTGTSSNATFEIKTLNSTSLKIYYIDPNSPTTFYVTVFKRIN